MDSTAWQVMDVDGRQAVDLDELSTTFRVAWTVQVAWKVGIFGALLGGQQTAEEVAAACGTQPKLTEKVLVLLASSGLVFRRSDGTYRLTEAGRAAFDPESPRYYGDGMAHAASVWARWSQMEQMLKTPDQGPPQRAGGPPPMDDATHRAFVMAMQDYSIRGRVQWLVGNVDLSGRRHLLDLGGGPGTYAIGFVQAYPALRATIYDQPRTEPLARETAAKWGVADRIDFVGGNFDQDDLGTGYDCALLSNVLHGPGTGSEMRLQRVFEVLPEGGLLVIQDFLLDDDRNGPVGAAMFNLNVGAYTVGEMLKVIEAAGFQGATLRGRGSAGNGLVTAVRG